MAMATCAHVYTVYCARYAMQRHAMVCFKALDGRQCISKKGSREGARGARRPEERVGSYPASQPRRRMFVQVARRGRGSPRPSRVRRQQYVMGAVHVCTVCVFQKQTRSTWLNTGRTAPARAVERLISSSFPPSPHANELCLSARRDGRSKAE